MTHRPFLLLLLICLITRVSCLYFYLEGTEKKCFIEDLPKETMVIGVFKSEQLGPNQSQWAENKDTKIEVSVEVLPTSRKLLEATYHSSDRFVFTSVDSGDHAICISVSSSSWFDNTRTKLVLDMDFDDPSDNHDHNSEAVPELVKRVHELNERVEDIQIEQNAQREREKEFRDLSELINSRVVWLTIGQIVVLGAVCVWQMRYFKNFFVAKKLV